MDDTPVRAPPQPPWRPRHLLRAPHRVGFFLALVPLVASALWWAAQLELRRRGVAAERLPANVLHAAVMVYGFMPLFFAGFVCTALPRWLQVAAPTARQLLAPALLQSLGWLLWLCAPLWGAGAAWLGSALAALGQAWVGVLLLRMVAASRQRDQRHARSIAAAFLWGSAALIALASQVAQQRWGAVLAWVHVGLWGFVAVVFVAAAHRMLAFFSPDLSAGGPRWLEPAAWWLLLAALLGEVLALGLSWRAPAGSCPAVYSRALAGLQGLVAAQLLWQAVHWWRSRRPRQRLMRMFLCGLLWLALALALRAAGHALGSPAWAVAGVHALAMGCMGTLMLAMVTRVSCAHSGRAQVADCLLWGLFWLLQLATALRLLAQLGGGWTPSLLALAALCWALLVLRWALRLANWFGRPRPDGRPG